MKCLVTKLKASVSDDTLEKLGTVVIEGTMQSDYLSLTAVEGENIPVKVINKTSKKEWSSAVKGKGTTVVHFGNRQSVGDEVHVEYGNKYKLLGLTPHINPHYIDYNKVTARDLNYTRLLGFAVEFGTSLVGSINDIHNILDSHDINTYGCSNLQGEMEVLLDNLHKNGKIGEVNIWNFDSTQITYKGNKCANHYVVTFTEEGYTVQ